jgi:glycine/sarcosine N-methyltransferase
MANQDAYEGFAERYDLFFGRLNEPVPTAYSEFFRALFTGNKVRSVLDCACGTGRDMILLQSLGYDVAGSDVSSAMIAQARKNIFLRDIKIPLIEADYRELPEHYAKSFDAVICLSSAIDEMPSEAEAIRALGSMFRALNPGGILLLTQGTTDKQWSSKSRFIPMINTRDFSRICVIDYLEKGARYNILDVYHSDAIKEFKTWTMNFAQFLLKDDLDKLLKVAGFMSLEFYGSYGFEPYDKGSSNRLIVVAHKQ